MKFRRILSGFGLTSIVVASAMYISSCTPMITEEQKLQLKDLRNKERSLTDAIAQKKSDKSKIEGELNSRKSELKKCTDEKDLIQQRLSTWPNCWPDWKPVVPEATEGEQK
jgi:uncharacterized protein (DUF3084 family)